MKRIFVSRFLTNSPSYGVGWLRETEPISARRTDGYIPAYRRDVTYLREKNRRNEKNLPLVLADSSWETTREATFAKPICRNIRRRRCFSGRPLLTLSCHDPLFSTDIIQNPRYMEALSVIFSFKKKISFTSFAKIRNYFNFNEETKYWESRSN